MMSHLTWEFLNKKVTFISIEFIVKVCLTCNFWLYGVVPKFLLTEPPFSVIA